MSDAVEELKRQLLLRTDEVVEQYARIAALEAEVAKLRADIVKAAVLLGFGDPPSVRSAFEITEEHAALAKFWRAVRETCEPLSDDVVMVYAVRFGLLKAWPLDELQPAAWIDTRLGRRILEKGGAE